MVAKMVREMVSSQPAHINDEVKLVEVGSADRGSPSPIKQKILPHKSGYEAAGAVGRHHNRIPRYLVSTVSQLAPLWLMPQPRYRFDASVT